MPARNTPTCPAVVPLCGTKAEVTVPSLDDWEKELERGARRAEILKVETLKLESGRRKGETTDHRQQTTVPKLLPVDFRSPLVAIAHSN